MRLRNSQEPPQHQPARRAGSSGVNWSPLEPAGPQEGLCGPSQMARAAASIRRPLLFLAPSPACSEVCGQSLERSFSTLQLPSSGERGGGRFSRVGGTQSGQPPTLPPGLCTRAAPGSLQASQYPSLRTNREGRRAQGCCYPHFSDEKTEASCLNSWATPFHSLHCPHCD